jgi:hypothetical protein
VNFPWYVRDRRGRGKSVHVKLSFGTSFLSVLRDDVWAGNKDRGKTSLYVVAQGVTSRGTLASLGGDAATPAGEGGWGSTFKVSRPRSSRMGRRLTSWNGSSSSPDLTTRKSGECLEGRQRQ